MHKMSLLMNKNVLFGAFGWFSGVWAGVLTRFERFRLIGDCIGVRLCDFVQCVCWVGRLRSGGWPILFMGFFTAVCGVLIGCFPARWLGGCFIVAGMSACGWLGLLRVSARWCGVECSGFVLVVACSVSAVRLASTNPPAGTPNCICGCLLRNRSATMLTGNQWKSTKHSSRISWTISCASAHKVVVLYAWLMSRNNYLKCQPCLCGQRTCRLEHLTACLKHELRNRSATMRTGVQ